MNLRNDNLPDAPEIVSRTFSFALLRQSRAFWLTCVSLPLATATVLVGLSLNDLSNVAQKCPRYVAAVEASYHAGDLAAASRYFAKLRSLDYEYSPNAQLIGAVLDLRAGRTENAERQLETVAPPDRQGFRPAHLWRAKELIKTKSAEPSPVELSAIRHHLECAAGIDEEDAWISSQLAQVCTALKDYPSALRHIADVVDRQPELYVLMAAIHNEMGNFDSRLAALQKAEEVARERLTADPKNVALRLALAQLLKDQTKNEEALKIIVVGLNMDSAHPQLRDAAATLCVARYDELVDSEADDIAGKLGLLEQSLSFSPSNGPTVARLEQLMTGTTEQSDATDQALRRMLAQGEAVGTVHLVFGLRALMEDDQGNAAIHLQQSYDALKGVDQSPQVPALLNNLAWLTMQKGEDYDRALALANEAVGLLSKNDPRAAFIRETRGQIHLRMKEWKQAVSDLEFALPRFPGNRNGIHRSLAKAYRGLGQELIAEEHDKLADEASRAKPSN